jgi:hypothetical protein
MTRRERRTEPEGAALDGETNNAIGGRYAQHTGEGEGEVYYEEASICFPYLLILQSAVVT